MTNYSSPGIYIAGVNLLLLLLVFTNIAPSIGRYQVDYFLFHSANNYKHPVTNNWYMQLGDTCVVNSACPGDGLHCETCIANGNIRPRCTRISPVDPKSKAGTGLPFNRYSWLTTHNSFSILNSKTMTGVPIVTAFNQQDSITAQLNVSTYIHTYRYIHTYVFVFCLIYLQFIFLNS